MRGRDGSGPGAARLPGLNTRLVMELDRGRSREMLLAVLLSGVVLLPLLVYVWQNVEWFRSGYRIEELKSRRDRLAEAARHLRLERSSLQDLSRVERVAVEDMGLREPPGGTVVLVDRERLPAGPATPAAPSAVAQHRPDASGTSRQEPRHELR